MKLTQEAAEKAAKFCHERTRELLSQCGFDESSEDFPPWEELPEGVKGLAIQVITELIGNLLIGYAASPHGGN